MNASDPESQPDREIVLTRDVAAPRDLVWTIWTEYQHVTQWWGPSGFTATTEEMDVRPGGSWRFVFHGPDGRQYPNHIRYLEVTRPSRLVYEHVGETGHDVVFKSIVTLEQVASGGTRVTLRTILPSSEARDRVVREFGAIEGGKQTLARMAEHAAALASRSSEPHELVVHRVFDAPRALVYAMWTDVEHLARWFGPKGCTLEGCELDLRVGGTFLYCMRFPNGLAHWAKLVFREIVPGERLSFVAAFTDEHGAVQPVPFDPRCPPLMLITVTIEEHAGIGRGTVVTLRSSAFDATADEQRAFDEHRESMREGWSSMLNQLADHLAARKA